MTAPPTAPTRAPQHARSAVCFIALVACIPVANWFVHNVGAYHGPNAPHTIDFIYVSAPSGVLFAGFSFTLRDLLQTLAGGRAVLLAILAGAALSAMISPGLAIASAAAFAVSELIDMSVYSWFIEQSVLLAVLGSNLIAAAADSAVFLLIAFGSESAINYGPDQFMAKFAASLAIGYPAIRFLRRRVSAASATRAGQGQDLPSSE